MIVNGLARMRMQPRWLCLIRSKRRRVAARPGWRPMHLLWTRRRRLTSASRNVSLRQAVPSPHGAALHLSFTLLHNTVGTSHRTFFQAAGATRIVRQSHRHDSGQVPVRMLMRTVSALRSEHLRVLRMRDETVLERRSQRMLATTEHRHSRRDIRPAGAASKAPMLITSSTIRCHIITRDADAVTPARLPAAARPAILVHHCHQSAFRPAFGRAETHPSAPVAVSHRRPADLVWRADGGTQRAGSIENLNGGMMRSSPAAVPFERPVPTTSVPPSLQIDPGMVDRIATDVIGRIERRMRVERERRGL